MRIYLTGATGFIGSRVLKQLLGAGHQVTGLTRSDSGERWLAEAGATPHRGTLDAPMSVARGAEQADAVIHTAFDHEFSRYVENCEKDRCVIGAIAEVLKGSSRPLIITSGTAMGATAPGEPATEHTANLDHPLPRVASEKAGRDAADGGVSVAVVRLPQVHDPERQGLISPLVAISRAKSLSAYVGDGSNRWAAAHVDDVALLYRLALEQHEPGARYHAVAEEGVSLRLIAETIGAGLGVPVRSLAPGAVGDHFGWMSPFMALDMPASSTWTRERLNWTPTGPDLISDLKAMDYGRVETVS